MKNDEWVGLAYAAYFVVLAPDLWLRSGWFVVGVVTSHFAIGLWETIRKFRAREHGGPNPIFQRYTASDDRQQPYPLLAGTADLILTFALAFAIAHIADACKDKAWYTNDGLFWSAISAAYAGNLFCLVDRRHTVLANRERARAARRDTSMPLDSAGSVRNRTSWKKRTGPRRPSWWPSPLSPR